MKKVLVIVAHPDDETIWMGGTILENISKWDLTIISLCRKNDKDRAPKFKKVCKLFNARSFISDLDDSEEGDYKKISEQEIIERIQKFADKEYDLIFTHGENGEYGHIRHIEVHNTVEKMIKNEMLTCKQIFFFAYVRDGAYCAIDSNANKFINLDNFETIGKKRIIRKIYGFKKKSFEFGSANKQESFKTN
ncbi:MAG: PIG-L family deacetylase [Nanoarchaeota archaeon]|nr:PIG-L family deacetylase [Nanoarchaeota archaeon]